MSTDPEQLRAEIERTRTNLSNDVDALTEHVAPANVAKRQTEKVKGAVSSVKDRVMGTADDIVDTVTDKVEDVKDTVTGKAADMKDTVTGKAGELKDTVSDKVGSGHSSAGSSGPGALQNVSGAASSAKGAAAQAPARLRSASRGNPLAAGLIALGAGWLLGSLIPASRREQQLAARLKDNAGALAAPAKEIAQDIVGNVKSSAQDSVLSGMKDTALKAAGAVVSEGASAAKHVQGEAKDAQAQTRQSR